MSLILYQKFSSHLTAWYAAHARHTLPWRATHDPYRLLVSEVMLQQTQVPRVIPKYAEFLKKFPTVKKLAAAKSQEVLSIWDGLGYFRRARDLHEAAKKIEKDHQGKFSLSPAALIQLPGVGEYTAGAVACFTTDTFFSFYDINIRRTLIHELKVRDEKIALYKALEKLFSISHLSPRDFYYALFDYGSFLKGKDSQKIVSKKQSEFKGSFRSFRSLLLKKIVTSGSIKTSTALNLLENSIRKAEVDIHPQAVISSLKKDKLVFEKKNLLLIL